MTKIKHHSHQILSQRRRRINTAKVAFFTSLAAYILYYNLFTNTNNRASINRKTLQEWDLPYIHIINTRFMQDQGSLQHLGKARLSLFETFCLPTIQHQTSQNFIWIIKTDPHLDVEVREQMVELLKPHKNYFLVGSNRNYLIGHDPGAWRGGVEGEDVLGAPLFTGDRALLESAYVFRDEKLVLETRLDADDGLHSRYMEMVQISALEMFDDSADDSADVPKWLYWCARRHVEWYADATIPSGKLDYIVHEKLCVTPGITVAFPVGTSYPEVPQYEHDRLCKTIHAEGGCGLSENKECLVMMDDFPVAAVRSRTPTSAGMMGVDLNKDLDKPPTQLWSYLEENLFVLREESEKTNRFIFENLSAITMDNLKGQCTEGHSCKLSSKESLQRMIELASEGGRGVSILG